MKKLLAALFLALAVSVAHAGNEVGYIYDSRDFAMVEIVSSKQVTNELSLWGFTDLYNDQSSKDNDLSHHFMEYRADFEIFSSGGPFLMDHLYLEAEYNGFDGPNNDLMRYGMKYQIGHPGGGNINFRYFHFDSRGPQYRHFSITHFFPLINDFSFFGFYDYHINDKGEDIWYMEPSLIYEIDSTYSLILIYRWDGFEHRTPDRKGNGIALGVYMQL